MYLSVATRVEDSGTFPVAFRGLSYGQKGFCSRHRGERNKSEQKGTGIVHYGGRQQITVCHKKGTSE